MKDLIEYIGKDILKLEKGLLKTKGLFNPESLGPFSEDELYYIKRSNFLRGMKYTIGLIEEYMLEHEDDL